MPIVGHGIDLVEVARIERMLTDHPEQFLDRCFTTGEQSIAADAPRKAEHIAGRFAAKEAVLKALGTGWRHGIAWTEIEVLRDDAGKPILKLSGHAARFAEAIRAVRWSISISHIQTHAIASAIAEDMS